MAQVGALAVVAAASLGFAPTRAHACSGTVCTPSLYFPAQGTVPANLPGFYWWPSKPPVWDNSNDGGTWRDASDLLEQLRLARVDGASPEWLEVTLQDPDAEGGPYLIVPKVPLVVGGHYTLWDATDCDGGLVLALDTPPAEADWLEYSSDSWPRGIARVTAAAVAPLPEALGSLSAGDPATGPISVADDSACSTVVDMLRVELTLAHDAAAQAWRDVFFYATEVDDGSYAPQGDYHPIVYHLDYTPGTSFAGRGSDLVYTDCDPNDHSEGVEPGPHRARFRATIPGTDVALQTNEVSFTLSCPELPDAGSDAGSDAGPSDRGSNPMPDRMDSGADDASAPGRQRADPREDDDGCNVAGPAGSATSWPFLLALGWLARRRRA